MTTHVSPSLAKPLRLQTNVVRLVHFTKPESINTPCRLLLKSWSRTVFPTFNWANVMPSPVQLLPRKQPAAQTRQMAGRRSGK